MSESAYEPTLLGSGQPPAGESLIVVVARPEFGYYVNVIISNISNDTVDLASIAVVPAGVVPGPQCFIAFETPVIFNQLTVLANVGLGPQDQIIVRSEFGFLNFNVTGNKFYDL
jgi:hypothetical protein